MDFVCEHRHKNKLEKMFPSASPEAIALLKGLLEFNPHFRLGASEALQSPIFNKIRRRHFEKPCPIKIKQKIHGDGAFDYVAFQDIKYSIKDYKKMLLSEQKKIRKISILYQ